jgi:DNA replication protein DnaC
VGHDLVVLLNGLCGHSPQARRPSIVCTLSTPGGHCHEQGKTHLATALGYTACLQGYSVLFASAIDVINTLAAAKSAGRLKAELKKYTKPALLILDELGYLPIDKTGADLLFQVISLRYEQGAIIITSNRAFKEWPVIFNHDSTLTSAVLDRLLHHADTVIIEGKSFRMKDQIET